MNEEQIRAEFEVNAGSLGFDLSRTKINPNVEPWDDYTKEETGHRWGGFLAGWQAALSAKSVPEQMGSPIQKLMEYLINILDEDEFNQCDSILAGQGISATQPTDDRVRELEKDAARYRWLRNVANDEVAVVSGLGAMDYGMSAVVFTYSEEIDGDDLDATIDRAITSWRENRND